MSCANCGAVNREGRKFCSQCGASLGADCPSCGAANEPGERFCGECGTALMPIEEATAPRAATTSTSTESGTPAHAAERRLVSVLFADLVGFTVLSESRDPEEVRDLLSRFFDGARRVIDRYGGVVEKFIGDAVMAVWGAPVANEDDPERAVRAALELVATVAALGEEIAAPELAVRAGVLTGEAAVNLGAEGQGMVAGDLVNTASRIQAAAAPGQVYVGEATRRASEAAIVYAELGAFELKGKAEPVPLWRAERVVAATRGAQRASGLEAPFVGRDRELRLIKDAFHVAEQGKAQLLSVVGPAGIGKSRLVWEFFKYIDGLATQVRWHRGRCLAYGEGVTYWALAEMVRTNADILEGEDNETAVPKLHAAVERATQDAEERRWIVPRLASLLGLESGRTRDREDLFAAWRRFYERLAEEMPTVMVFEDIQWADASLLDFVEYLMEWSRDHALFVLTLARPEISDKRPNWGTGRRSTTSVYLEPLGTDPMDRLLTGLVPGLPEDVRGKVLDRAEGVPLYAVETVRMLLDRGLVQERGGGYHPASVIDELDVPETLHGLIAARLDGLTQPERRLAQDAAVVGKTFTKQALASVSGLDEAEMDRLIQTLMRKEVLTVQADPFSPERGQFMFVGDLIRWVAYETLSKRERRTRHLAAAAHLQEQFEEDDVAEVVASHLVHAYEAAPDAADAVQIRAKAEEAMRRAGDRAASVAARTEARSYFERAIELADDPIRRATLHERAADMAWSMGDGMAASEHHEGAIELYDAAGDRHAAARVSAANAEVRWVEEGGSPEALDRMQRAFEILSNEEPDEALATLAAQLGRYLYFANRFEEAAARLELALTLAEGLQLPEVLAQALNTKSLLLGTLGRPEESSVLIERALQIALDHDLGAAALRGYNNYIASLGLRNRHEEELAAAAAGLDLARRLGSRRFELVLLACHLNPLVALGRWDEALGIVDKLEAADDPSSIQLDQEISLILPMFIHRGELGHARVLQARLERFADSTDVQIRITARTARAMVRLAEGDASAALEIMEPLLTDVLGPWTGSTGDPASLALDAAIEAGDLAAADRLLKEINRNLPGALSPTVRAASVLARARIAGERGDQAEAERGFKQAVGLFREIQVPFHRAVALTHHARFLTRVGRGTEAGPLVDEARGVFEALGAVPWMERLDAIARADAVTSAKA